MLQITVTMVFVLISILETCQGVCCRHDLLGGDPVWNAVSGVHLNPPLQLEDDQGNGVLHVFTLLCVRCYLAMFRVRISHLSSVMNIAVTSQVPYCDLVLTNPFWGNFFNRVQLSWGHIAEMVSRESCFFFHGLKSCHSRLRQHVTARRTI